MAVKGNMQESAQKTGYKFGKVGVLMGGPSTERQISLKSGEAVMASLNNLGIAAQAIDIKNDNVKENIDLIKSFQIDCAFIALHGHFGEDGQIQKILDSLKIPYTGSGAMSSKLAMDKIASRQICDLNGIAVPKYKVLNKGYFTRSSFLFDDLLAPFVVKPATHGSSIGLSIVDKPEELDSAIKNAFSFDENILVEEYIEGREVTVSVLNDCALPVIEIVPKKRFFDYEAKYQPGMTEYIVPAVLEDQLACRIQETALKVHRLLDCSGCSRVDIIVNKENVPVVLELNTIPGLTKTSLLPKAAKLAGIEFDQLCIRLIESAYEKASKALGSTS